MLGVLYRTRVLRGRALRYPYRERDPRPGGEDAEQLWRERVPGLRTRHNGASDLPPHGASQPTLRSKSD